MSSLFENLSIKSFCFLVLSGIYIPFIVTWYQNANLSKVSWLLGTWENQTPRGRIFEEWIPQDENNLSARSYMVQGQDTIVFETIKLMKVGDQYYYVPTVKNQNNSQPVRFTASTVSDQKMVFENPDHDFPQIISYQRIGSDSLVAEVSGSIDGRIRKQVFPMKKVE